VRVVSVLGQIGSRCADCAPAAAAARTTNAKAIRRIMA